MDLSKAKYSDEATAELALDELGLEGMAAPEDEGDELEDGEDADIALAIGTDDPERVAAMKSAIEACVRRYGG